MDGWIGSEVDRVGYHFDKSLSEYGGTLALNSHLINYVIIVCILVLHGSRGVLGGSTGIGLLDQCLHLFHWQEFYLRDIPLSLHETNSTKST